MYNFNKIINRRNTKSLKWDFFDKKFKKHNFNSFSVADMDFAIPDQILKTITMRLKHPILGYSILSDNFYQSIIGYLNRKHNWEINKEWIVITNSIMEGIGIAIKSLIKKDDSIIIQTPAYAPFYKIISSNSCKVLKNRLIIRNNKFSINFEELDILLKSAKILLLSNPHNPSGRVFSRKEIIKISKLCKKHNVFIISDEVHSGIIFDNKIHYPIAKSSIWAKNNSITMMSPSKTFNIAGLPIAIAVIPGNLSRKLFLKYSKSLGYHFNNILGAEALEAAYSKCDKWLIKLLKYLQDNRNYVTMFLKKYLDKSKYYGTEGTFLMWIDFSEYGKFNEIEKKFITKGNININNGYLYGDEGKGFFRLNIGCSINQLKKGLNLIAKSLKEC